MTYFSQLKAAEGAQYSTDQAIKLEMELVELKAERAVMSLRVRKTFVNIENKKKTLELVKNKSRKAFLYLFVRLICELTFAKI